jgi:hypothetical protein
MFTGYQDVGAAGSYGGETIPGDPSNGAFSLLLALNPLTSAPRDFVVPDAGEADTQPAVWPNLVTYVTSASSISPSFVPLDQEQEGDVYLAIQLSQQNISGTYLGPPGWTLLDRVNNSGTGFVVSTWTYTVTSVPAYSYHWTLDSQGQFNKTILLLFRDLDPLVPIAAHAGRDAPDNALPTLTLERANALLVSFVLDWDGLTNTDPDQGYTLASGVPSGFGAFFVGYKPADVPGLYGGESFSGSPGSGAATFLVALNPAPLLTGEGASGGDDLTVDTGTVPISVSTGSAGTTEGLLVRELVDLADSASESGGAAVGGTGTLYVLSGDPSVVVVLSHARMGRPRVLLYIS